MKLTEAMEILSILKELVEPHILPAHRQEAKEALDLGISALKTIEDGNYQLNKLKFSSVYGMMCYKDTDSAGMIDLKTLYEQMTMCCDLVGEVKDGNTFIFEKYHQPNTPIDVDVHWDNNRVVKMTFEIREGKGI